MDVNEFCTCGAKLPEGARFCHKCGKPQYELIEPEPEVLAEPEPPVAEVVAAAPALPPDISMRNPFAVRTAFAIASVAAFLTMMPLPAEVHWLWQIVLLVAGGFAAVWLYERRTGIQINVRSGARLGWMMGAFCFLILLVIFTILFVFGDPSNDLKELSRQMEAQNGSSVARQFEELMSSAAGATFLIILTAAIMFVPVTLLSMAGGALGAKILEKE